MLITLLLLSAASRPASAYDHRVSVNPHCVVRVNGYRVSRARLRRDLRQWARRRPEPELHFQPDPNAPYRCVDQILGDIRRSMITKIGFIGNEQSTTDDPEPVPASPRR